jgi:D-arabinono-1,4-lactone oxidase
MKDLGGKPHWAKNFSSHVSRLDFSAFYGEELTKWRAIRSEVDPEGMFVGEWHRRNILDSTDFLPLEEREFKRTMLKSGGTFVEGRVLGIDPSMSGALPDASQLNRLGSQDSFDMMVKGEAEESIILHPSEDDENTE